MIFLFLGAYALVLCLIAFYSCRRTRSESDFLLGGRKSGPWISAFAYGTTYFSAVIFVGYAGKFGWNVGLSSVLIGVGNAVVGSLLAFLVLGKRTRSMSHQLGARTMPEFFARRYNSRILKLLSAAIIFVFLVPYSASVYQGLSHLLERALGIRFEICIIGMAALTALYLVLGGYTATALTDFVQGLIMLTGVAAMVFYVLRAPQLGGLAQGIETLADIDPALVSLPKGQAAYLLWPVLILTSAGSWAMPQMVQKFYAIRDAAAIRRGAVISFMFALVVGVGAYFTGSFARLFLDNHIPADPATGLANVDMIIPQMLDIALPTALMGLIVMLVVSASMSTLSGLAMAAGSALSTDLIRELRPHMGEKQAIRNLRLFCLLFVALSVTLALLRISAIVTMMSFSWGTIAGCFLGPYLYGLFDVKTNTQGAAAGMVSGLLTSLVLALLTNLNGAHAPAIGCCAMLCSLIVTPCASRMAVWPIFARPSAMPRGE